ncbi:hypothetical protein ACFXG1_13185 [Streptomyces sp. NPDC059248]|uniref:hypothetical protein n=1 Tax=Streptomyces sp. NPDC059248 TaxID=3346791 RepID=UPI003699C813
MHTIRVTGEIRIQPPLPQRLTQATPYHPDNPETPPYGCDLILHLDTTGNATHLTTRRHDTHALTHQIQHALNTFPDHTFTGHLHCHGNQPGNQWHITITNGHAKVTRTAEA